MDASTGEGIPAHCRSRKLDLNAFSGKNRRPDSWVGRAIRTRGVIDPNANGASIKRWRRAGSVLWTAFHRESRSRLPASLTSGCPVHGQPFKRRRAPHLPDHDGAGLLLLSETPERFLFVGVGLKNSQKLGYLHEVVHSLLQVQQFHLAASVGDGGIAAD